MDDGDEAATGPEVEDALGADTPDTDDPTDGPDVVEIEHRVGELEEGIERNEGRIESVQHSQEEVAERVEEMNETVRDLLGVYERLTADDNPFTDPTGDGGAGGFGVVNGDGERERVGTNGFGGEGRAHEAAEDAARTETGADPEPGTDADRPARGADADEDEGADVFTFDDVVADLEGNGASGGTDGPGGHDEPDESERPAATTDPEGAVGNGGPSADPHAGGGSPDSTPYLATLPDSYATDVLTLEWLAGLVETTGPAAALKAVAYYEDVGWIGPSVAADLEEYLAGPGVDVHVDPTEPEELAVEDHATSYEYVLKLGAIRELERTA